MDRNHQWHIGARNGQQLSGKTKEHIEGTRNVQGKIQGREGVPINKRGHK